MLFWLGRLLQKMRRSKAAGVTFVILLTLLALLGNAFTFLYFDGPDKPDLTLSDALWYSIISMTTIGYGDFSATSTGARLGTVIFVVIIGLSSFSALLGLLIDYMMQLNYKELHGLAQIHSKEHILIINFPDAGRVEHIIKEIRSDEAYAKKDVVLVTDRIETMPFDIKDVFFVHGSPLQIDVLKKANLADASMAIVLCTANDDPSSDGQVASVLNMVEHLHPGVKTVAECIDERHEILFSSTQCDSVVYTNHVINNLLVQEIQDTGVAALISTLTQNEGDETLYSAVLDKDCDSTYQAIAEKLAGKGGKLLSIFRDGKHHVLCEKLKCTKGDVVVYIAAKRLPASELV